MTEREIILCDLLKCTRSEIYLKDLSETCLDPKQRQDFEFIIHSRKQGVPLQYLLGKCEFFGLAFKLSRDVFIPRPETELLVEYALSEFKDKGFKRGLDIGTGSGAIAVSLAANASFLKICAIDVSPEAIKLAGENALLNRVSDRIDFFNTDVVNYQSDQKLDFIVSNPPYIKKSDIKNLPPEVKHEPFAALCGGEDGLRFYKIIFQKAKTLLKPGGILICEIGDDQAKAICRLIKEFSFLYDFKLYQDHCFKDRIISLRMRAIDQGLN